MGRKSRFQDDDFTFEQVLSRVETWLRQEVNDRETALVELASRHLGGGSCPSECRTCGVSHVVMHCHLAELHQAAYGLAEYLTNTRDQLDGVREQLAVAHGRYRKTLVRSRPQSLPTDETRFAGEGDVEKAGCLLGAAVARIDRARQDILGRRITPSLAEPSGARRPAHLRTVVEAYLSRDGWRAADVHWLLDGKAPSVHALKRMYARAAEAKKRGDLELLTLRNQPKRTG